MTPILRDWDGHKVVKISSVPGFQKWLWGQTCPLVSDDPEPDDWAYEWDYQRFIEGRPIID